MRFSSLFRPSREEWATHLSTFTMQEHDKSPLIKEVPGHLLEFEEKILGMSLTQLLTDLGALFGTIAVTTSMPMTPRIVVDVLTMIVALILVHGKVGGYTMLYWLYLIGRTRFLPMQTVWRATACGDSQG